MIEKILEKERNLSTLDSQKLSRFIYGAQGYEELKNYLEAGPTLPYTPNVYNKSRLELIKDSYRYLPNFFNYPQNHGKNLSHHVRGTYSIFANPHQNPAGAHFIMFVKYIQLMGTEQHKRKYLEKAKNMDIVGCYAQTELGHGSDIKGLETTAEYDIKTKQWIINSPTISSGKYWPGELAIIADYAIVFAQTFIKGKNYGVLPFLVQIKDKDLNWLPGIEGGDIGPKIGFHAKENGFMYLRSVRIPKENLLNKYVQVTDCGEFKQLEDPRIGYGTMMFVREAISCAFPRVYSAVITIGSRYSLFRKQFLSESKQEQTILDYQTQQEKIIPRIAQFYAISVAGNKIRDISQQNGRRILKRDFSLLQETHSNLAFSKGLFSQIVHEGMETIRRSIGGHGTSYYSGVPQIMNEYVANNTHEGQNTVMYIQTARYILKGYLGHMTKGIKLAQSVCYIARFGDLEGKRFVGKQAWTLEEINDLLVMTLKYLLTLIGTRIANKKQGETEADIINFKVGIRLQQLAQIHGIYFMVHEFIKEISKSEEQIRSILIDLCKLFAIGQLHKLAEPIIQTGSVCPQKWTLLSLEKQNILKKLRPHTARLVDSFAIPEKYIRSELTHGNPYLNYLNRARECQINASVSDAALTVGRIREVLSAKPRL